jgi:hypothetical protein
MYILTIYRPLIYLIKQSPGGPWYQPKLFRQKVSESLNTRLHKSIAVLSFSTIQCLRKTNFHKRWGLNKASSEFKTSLFLNNLLYSKIYCLPILKSNSYSFHRRPQSVIIKALKYYCTRAFGHFWSNFVFPH